MNGWVGTKSQLLGFLAVVGCDSTDGAFHVDGSITTFMGAGEEYCVGADAVYYVKGRAFPLAAGLAGTSYGLQVTVIT